MSCQSCSGCFTGSSCSTTKVSKKEALSDEARFQSLIELATTSKDLKLEIKKEHDHVIPTIMSELSKNVYSSQTVLFQAFDTLPQQDFLLLAKYLYQLHIVGAHIAWAYEFCENNVEKLLDILKNVASNNNIDGKLSALIQHCNDQAEIHEMFGQLPTGSVGRVNTSLLS